MPILIVDPAPAALASPALPIDDIVTVPASTTRFPLNVLVPLSVKLTLGALALIDPLPLTLPLTRWLPAPPNVTWLEVDMPPERVRSPASELIWVAPPIVMGPPKVLLPEMLRKAPVELLTPVPVSERASAPTVMSPWSCRAAPVADTVVPPAVVPSALLFWMFNAPALIVVAPV